LTQQRSTRNTKVERIKQIIIKHTSPFVVVDIAPEVVTPLPVVESLDVVKSPVVVESVGGLGVDGTGVDGTGVDG
jgi:hypothetical protein